jgi:hypothetical protein
VAVSVISSDCSNAAFLLALQASAMIATTPLSEVAQSVTALHRASGAAPHGWRTRSTIGQRCERTCLINAQC